MNKVGKKTDYRSGYRRNADSILHSKAYARYVDKTQVVYLIDNDHISQRGLHVQLVSALARGIGLSLGLNQDLIEAIALGHDVGHPPFGHEGEEYLSQLAQSCGLPPFTHPCQSCRLFTNIEPLNLSLQVLDGFLCHDGGMQDTCMQPNFAKGWKEHRQEFARKQSDPEANITPMTLEGCLVKLCDTVSYLGRDLEDAISLGMIRREKVPATLLGQSNEALLRAFAEDLINQSKGKEYLQITEEMFSAIRTLRAFNFAHIYRDPRLKVESSKVQQSYRLLFHFLLDNFQKQGEESYIWQDFLCTKQPEYLEKTAIEQKVVDYIAGMTDGFFLRTLQKIFIPSQIDWSCKP